MALDNNLDEVIEITSGESDGEPYIDRRAILEPVITRVVDALGGVEGGVYRLGDEVNGCLKDLKKLWRKDDTDDERTVARIFWETRVLSNDLVPILLETAGKGNVEDKRAISCADLMTAMTWPIDMSEELKELDEELDRGTDYTQLLLSHLHYKAALLKPGVIQALFGIVIPPLAKTPKERKERDGQIISVVLHLIRNLAFIKDLPANSHLSADQAELSSLQSKLILCLSETHTIRLLLTIASNSDNDPLMNSWNTLVLEIFYLLFRGVKPTSLAMDQSKRPFDNLHRLIAAEDKNRKDFARKATSRHSRFGTTITVSMNKKARLPDAEDQGNDADSETAPSKSFVLHHQQAIHRAAGSIMDMTKRHKSKKGTTVDALARDDNLSIEARGILQTMATDFVQACFNPFLSALLKDIRSERPKITEKDNLRLLYVTKWFLEFFLVMRAKEKGEAKGIENWGFGLVSEVTERTWIVWVLKRMREAYEEKPKLWTELQGGIECLTQLLLLIDKMSSSEITDPALAEAADVLQQQLIYNGEVLDIALESLRVYKEGTQSLAYLHSSVYLAYALLRLLERWSKTKGGEAYVRKKTTKKRKIRKAITEEEGIPDVEEEIEEIEDLVHETIFTFEAFEMKFAHADITHTLLIYLARYKEFTSVECMRRVVSLMHRQAVRAKAEGLFFKVSTLDLFKSILNDQKSFPREQPYKDLISLINFILRKFFKALAEDSFLAIEAFFPKNRGHWKQYSSWEPPDNAKQESKIVDTRFPPDVEVKKGYSWSDQLGITIASLLDREQKELVEWTKEVLAQVIRSRRRIIEETDRNDDDITELPEGTAGNVEQVSAEAIAKFTDYLIPYLSDEQADAATKNPHLKLLFRLSKFFILDEDADELEWYVPAGVAPSDLQSTLNVITQFLESPMDLEGKKASELFSKKSRRRRRRRAISPDNDGSPSEEESERKVKKKKEKQQYKSAQFIEDSDEEYGDMDAFLKKEEELRARMKKASDSTTGNRPATMKSAGTKKRRRKAVDSGSKKKRKGDHSPSAPNNVGRSADDREDLSSGSDLDLFGSRQGTPIDGVGVTVPKPKARPKPRPIGQRRKSSPPKSPTGSPRLTPPREDEDAFTEEVVGKVHRPRRLIISDEEE